MFDENVIMAAGEDNDYKHRCKLNDVTISCLGISADFNASETGGDSIPTIRDKNIEFVQNKWNNYTSEIAHQDIKYNNNPELYISDRLEQEYNTKIFPSIAEYNKFKQLKKY